MPGLGPTLRSVLVWETRNWTMRHVGSKPRSCGRRWRAWRRQQELSGRFALEILLSFGPLSGPPIQTA